jgi:hypothetical protein
MASAIGFRRRFRKKKKRGGERRVEEDHCIEKDIAGYLRSLPDHVERAESEARRDTRYDDVVTRAREPRRRELLITYFFALKNAPEHEIKSRQASGQSGIGSRRISVERLVSRFRNSDI